MPTSTGARNDDLCIRIRKLCAKQFESSEESELHELLKELQDAIKHHVQMAKRLYRQSNPQSINAIQKDLATRGEKASNGLSGCLHSSPD